MKPLSDDTTQIVRLGVERACKDFNERIANLGFKQSKKMYWTRRHPHTVDFIHLHRSGSSYGKPVNYSVNFTVHFGVRILNDPSDEPALNGPYSDVGKTREGRYHLRFNARSGSAYDRCIDDLVRFVKDQGQPWFSPFSDPKRLLTDINSPLNEDVRTRLRFAIIGNADPDVVVKSLKLLGIKDP